jgi:hypothetical protein
VSLRSSAPFGSGAPLLSRATGTGHREQLGEQSFECVFRGVHVAEGERDAIDGQTLHGDRGLDRLGEVEEHPVHDHLAARVQRVGGARLEHPELQGIARTLDDCPLTRNRAEAQVRAFVRSEGRDDFPEGMAHGHCARTRNDDD